MFFEILIISSGYIGLFVTSFISNTLFPLSSAVFVVLMVTLKYNPWLVLLVATIGSYVGAITNYYIGKYGKKFFFTKYTKIDRKKREKAHKTYRKYGHPILFFSWMPFIGDILCVIAGYMHLNFYTFTFWIFFGKTLRYAIVIWATLAIMG
jgi:membrane protein YqaA with SNARE-associated domain